MALRTTLNFTPALVRQSVWAYWKRSVGITLPLVLVLLTAYLVSLVRGGSTHWPVGVFGSIVALGYVYLAAMYGVQLRHNMALLREMGSPQGTLELNEAGFTVASSAGQTTLPWSSIQEVACFPAFWLVYLSPAQFFTLPLNDLPEAMQTEMLERVRQHGGKLP